MKFIEIELEAEQFIPSVARTWKTCREFVGKDLWVESNLGIFVLTLDGAKEVFDHNWIVKEARGNFVIWTEQDMKNVLKEIEDSKEGSELNTIRNTMADWLPSSMTSSIQQMAANGKIDSADWKGLTGIEKYNKTGQL